MTSVRTAVATGDSCGDGVAGARTAPLPRGPSASRTCPAWGRSPGTRAVIATMRSRHPAGTSAGTSGCRDSRASAASVGGPG